MDVNGCYIASKSLKTPKENRACISNSACKIQTRKQNVNIKLLSLVTQAAQTITINLIQPSSPMHGMFTCRPVWVMQISTLLAMYHA